MGYFFENLKLRNEVLFQFGWICLAVALILFIASRFYAPQVLGVNAWYKPIKFCLSATIFVWAMGWYMHYLGPGWDIQVFNWIIVGSFVFEIGYIAWQAGRGELSHFNVSSPFYGIMYGLMGLVASLISLATAYIGWRFFQASFPNLPDYYVWSIRLGILLFVVFSFQGFAMGSRLSHTIGAPDGSSGLPFLNWSLSHGDLRIAHFVGMHALQVLPFLAYFVFKDLRITVLVAALYFLLATGVWIQALQAKPFFKI